MTNPYQHHPKPHPGHQQAQAPGQQPRGPASGQRAAAGQQGYAAGNPTPQTTGDVMRTVLIASISAAAGAIVVRMLDNYVFTQKAEEIQELKLQVGEIRDHISRQPQIVVPAMPAAPPDRDRDRALEAFWERFGGDL